MIRTGLDILAAESGVKLRGRRTGLLANPSSVTGDFRPAADVLSGCGANLICLFGPQHGWWGETQANMIEWESFTHPSLGIPVHSLYGAHREPQQEALRGLDLVVIDLPDIGARPYTYLWTALLMMRRCAEAGIAVLVVDRPNPLGGTAVEGPLLGDDFHSFVGLYPLSMRHGLTIGEALTMMNESEGAGCSLEIVKMEGWDRSMLFPETGLPWVPPSPNMPAPETAFVYPGIVMLEATNISEGRGTTRPFEVIGAPWIDPFEYAAALSKTGLEGIIFRPLRFKPTWDKYDETVCGGVQLHVTDPLLFSPVRCGAVTIATAATLYPEFFTWKEPPYEYEDLLAPIDILSGDSRLRETIDGNTRLEELFGEWKADEELFGQRRKPYLLY